MINMDKKSNTFFSQHSGLQKYAFHGKTAETGGKHFLASD
jgi:hypothetical protein